LTLNELDLEGQAAAEKEEKLGQLSVLSPLQQKRLVHHQKKFSRSHTFYKPHETMTHHAFPLRLLVAAVVLLDCHSLLQIALGTCTWAISYHVRPFALTTVILCCSITCNITAGVVISVGDHKVSHFSFRWIAGFFYRGFGSPEAVRKSKRLLNCSKCPSLISILSRNGANLSIDEEERCTREDV
jgi:hypothetical protein